MPDLNTGDTIRLKAVFSVLDVNTDPSTVSLTVQSPAGVETTYTYSASITKEATGIYYKDVSLNESGYWVYEWTGTGTVASVQGNKIYVRGSLL